MIEVLGVVRRRGAVVLGRSVRGTGVVRSGLKLRRPGRCATLAPETQSTGAGVAALNAGSDHLGSGRFCPVRFPYPSGTLMTKMASEPQSLSL